MIISASYKTDVPAFYGNWFLRRIKAGSVNVANPYGGPVRRVSLIPDAVDGFVFWTRNAAPFGSALEHINGAGYPFVLHYTITGYPRELDLATPPAEAAIADFLALSRLWGARRLIWRYDPVLISSMTPKSWHLANFQALAKVLSGATDEVVLSFTHIYRKTRGNLKRAAEAGNFTWDDPIDAEKQALLVELATIANDHGMTASLCGQPDFLGNRLTEARCIDAMRLSEFAGHEISAGKRSHRKGCACAASIDIGGYDTCPHGCVYCYGVQSREKAKDALAGHDATAEILG
ncbi:MAG: DUF1848 domain-containing protein [Rhodospirillaceae bacterium]|jgi:hypothetical protein|nr:DUF1848 domain-containing protein [Rhodospirillaceae bacterium]MBT4118269.1 DUF1848 domain-containing protein [Rhodospirillaceae bacterium]MBT4673112.1 DUF1848 domain-containing protein [Rhodospirillaceae bacterium]MBT5178536.1 DUF1848 domain-containing protein [Rhodospirillaceae bacterium]MBT5838121.1 DUF1848 domain-containing protein [Rhodospirillaceae bacterium]